MELEASSRLLCPPKVLSRVLDGEAVLLHLETGSYFGMNEVATRAWELIQRAQGGLTYAQLSAALLVEFEVDATTLDRDLRDLVAALEKQQLLAVSHG